ncbi:MAG: hypothetical protein WAM91_07370 [Candidatus Acidiferrales bacterium]
MDDPARDYNICPSCGTEFGVSDVNATVDNLRANWLRSGPSWWSPTDPQPQNWNPLKQIGRLVNVDCGPNVALIYLEESAVVATLPTKEERSGNARCLGTEGIPKDFNLPQLIAAD